MPRVEGKLVWGQDLQVGKKYWWAGGKHVGFFRMRKTGLYHYDKKGKSLGMVKCQPMNKFVEAGTK